jgi:uncharacterized protein involved in tolerance to divalent cations
MNLKELRVAVLVLIGVGLLACVLVASALSFYLWMNPIVF